MTRSQLKDVGVEILYESSDEVIGNCRYSLKLDVSLDQIAQNIGTFDSLQWKTLPLAHTHYKGDEGEEISCEGIFEPKLSE